MFHNIKTKLIVASVAALSLIACDQSKVVDTADESASESRSNGRRSTDPNSKLSHPAKQDEHPSAIDIDTLIIKIGEIDESDPNRALKMLQLIDHIPNGDWSNLLKFINHLPPGSVSSRAFSAAIHRIAKESPLAWIDGKAKFAEHLTRTQMFAASHQFGEEFAMQNLFPTAINHYVSGSGASDPEKTAFLSGLLFRLDDSEFEQVTAPLGSLDYKTRSILFESRFDRFAKLPADSSFSRNLYLDAIVENDTTTQKLVGSALADANIPVSDLLRISRDSDGKLVDAGLLGYFDRVSSVDLNRSLTQLVEITEPVLRDKIIFSIFPKILDYDPATARSWAQQISDQERKNLLLKQLE